MVSALLLRNSSHCLFLRSEVGQNDRLSFMEWGKRGTEKGCDPTSPILQLAGSEHRLWVCVSSKRTLTPCPNSLEQTEEEILNHGTEAVESGVEVP